MDCNGQNIEQRDYAFAQLHIGDIGDNDARVVRKMHDDQIYIFYTNKNLIVKCSMLH